MLKIKDINEQIESIKSDVVKWRRYLHQNPELSYQEEKTSQFVFDTLLSISSLEVTRPTKTSVLARLIGNRPGKVLALRADMDALPINEESDVPFASANTGVMHACGHDGHTAMLLGAAKVLSQFQNQINGEIRFIFQHSEEMFPGGAQELVEVGVIDGVDEIIGLHLFPMLPTGKIAITPGYVSANSDTFEIKIIGKGGHASEPNQTIDPIIISAEIISNIQYIVSRKISSTEQAVISITEIHGGSAKNVIPDTVTIGGGVRSFDEETRNSIPKYLENIVKGITQAHSAKYKLEYTLGYGAVHNNEKVTSRIKNGLLESLGSDCIIDMPHFMGGEDFSAYLNRIPGCFIGIGSAPSNKEDIYPLHHPKFNIDERSLEFGLKVLLNAPMELLNS
ncbi:amidohydrolase [Fredinandcohnia onubensis]|uniref:amidohydrolase n=1 Tax=Fredinandcohnia onubensis TaxID=1571209 RepID=UPI000C0BC08E|nr:amidohydrolase [Fredinandcohnia onubensis]